MAECPVCGGGNYHEHSGFQGHEPVEPPEGWCDDCYYSWQYPGSDTEAEAQAHLCHIQEELPLLERLIATWKRVLSEHDMPDKETRNG